MHDYETTIDVLRELDSQGVGSSHNQRLALLAIACAGEPIQMGRVADRIGVSRGAMTTIIDGLVDARLVKRIHDIGDRRVVHVEATRKALAAIARAEKSTSVEAAA